MMTRLAIPALLFLGLASACTPTCEQVCKKARSCDVSPRLAQDECVRSCNTQTELYDDWEDAALQDALAAHKSCVVGATCDEINDGVCFDEDLFEY